jgi:lysophospholipase L1-like esterase
MQRVIVSLTLLTAMLAAPAGCGRAPRAVASPRAPAPAAQEWTGTHLVSPPPATPPMPQGTWVLHFGDSFVDAWLRQNLGPRFHAAGVRYVVNSATGTHTDTWASEPGLDRWLALRPSLVLVTLGANETDLPAPSARAYAVERIAHKIAASGAACAWITPPLWKGETGILEVIHAHSAPCLFVDSDALLSGLSEQERQPDRVHPNRRGGQRWADAVWSWLEDHRGAGPGAWGLTAFERRDGS